jgi:sigma-B regulation protein RsbU (phosphoserine phosphatase)
MTMFLGIVDTQSRTLRWASAGHDAPLLYDPELKQEVPIEGLGGLPLGVMENQTYEELTHANLRDGQIMLVGTDGLWESKNMAGEEFGKERVIATLRELAHLDAAGIEAELYQRLRAFCGEHSIDDDITYVVLKFTNLSQTPSAGGVSDVSSNVDA